MDLTSKGTRNRAAAKTMVRDVKPNKSSCEGARVAMYSINYALSYCRYPLYCLQSFSRRGILSCMLLARKYRTSKRPRTTTPDCDHILLYRTRVVFHKVKCENQAFSSSALQ